VGVFVLEADILLDEEPLAGPRRTPGPVPSALGLAGFLLLCFAVIGVGAWPTPASISTWYAGLAKPAFTPPIRFFALAWMVLCTLMAVAAWLVWRTPRRLGRRGSLEAAVDPVGLARFDALIVFYLQLALNCLWTPVFFHYHRLLVSSVVILALWIAILFTMVMFWRVRPLAGALLVPCLAGVSFATALNLMLLRLN
jgi:tryptophan-rich sensory protein